MDVVISNFLAAREHYLNLQQARTQPRTPEQREVFYIELLRAWLEVHYRAQLVAGVRFAEGVTFAEVN